MTNSPPLIELRQVSQIYGSGTRRFTAIQHVNLTVQEGEFVALLGPSGCGKSTLLRIITGLRPPSEGEALYRGVPLQGVNPHATIVFQTFALFPWLTVQENVEVALKARGIPSAIRSLRAVEQLDKVGLDGFENAYPRELSGGMRQKVGFARAMVVEPELLCLDEPFSALDVLSAESLRGELLELWTSGSIPTRAILMVTHNIEEAVFMADRIIVMEKDPGRVVAMCLAIVVVHGEKISHSPIELTVYEFDRARAEAHVRAASPSIRDQTTRKSDHSSGTPLRVNLPMESNARSEPATRSFTVLDTQMLEGPARSATREAM